MKIGYARVSTTDQTLEPQKDALPEAGCEKLFTDVASGARSQRPGLDETIAVCRHGDTLVVWKLYRMELSMSHLVEMIRKGQVKNIRKGEILKQKQFVENLFSYAA